MPSNEKIVFEQKGIGEVLSQNTLEVPLNQREYSWEKEHVRELFQDYVEAMDTEQGTHFLGTIVLTKATGDKPEVSDGQQRLSTTTILLAAIRDYLVSMGDNIRANIASSTTCRDEWRRSMGDNIRANIIKNQYLMTDDLATTDTVSKLILNVDDRDFFKNYVLVHPNDPNRKNAQPKQASNKRIKAAADFAAEFVGDFEKQSTDQHKAKRLLDLEKFIKVGAQVIVLQVPDHMNAFAMFETLNDRGLKASQADLLKNYLLSKSADSRLKEAQQYWARMVGILDTLGIDDVAVTYLHHFLISKYGFIKASDIYEKVKRTVSSPNKALEFLKELADSADDYAALFNTDNKKWNTYGTRVRNDLSIINRELRVTQIRPLMFAVAKNFTPQEATKAFRCFVCWSVRMLIQGGYGGVLERSYATQAYEIGNGKVSTAKELVENLRAIIPTDVAFENSFSVASVSQVRLGRYYLRALELEKKGVAEPELVPSDDEMSINLEHILPENPQQNWPAVDMETASAYYKRLGNMALLQAKKNSIIGNMSFDAKKPTFEDSEFVLTSEVATHNQWGAKEIEARQREMAELAVKTWPILK